LLRVPQLTAVCLLDLTAAFDTVDHDLLMFGWNGSSVSEESRSSGFAPTFPAQQRPFQTIVDDELISALPLSTQSAVEMLHNSALYKFMIDIDIDINIEI